MATGSNQEETRELWVLQVPSGVGGAPGKYSPLGVRVSTKGQGISFWVMKMF